MCFLQYVYRLYHKIEAFNKQLLCTADLLCVRYFNYITSFNFSQNSCEDFPGGTVVKNPPARGFPGGAVVESLPASAGDTGSSPGLGRSHMLRSN